MLLTCGQSRTRTYRVEVSGWDVSHIFFVERSELSWNEENGKQITLTRALNPGTMIFVRLLQATSADRSAAVPYQAEQLASTSEGMWQFRIHRAEPRAVATEAAQPCEGIPQ
jgi:hypothetical protein